MGWQHAYAGSGSAEIIGKVMRFLGLGQENCIDYASLIKIQDYLISCQDYRNLNIFGLKDYQLLLLPGLVAIFLALMMQLELDNIKVLPVALRHGVMASWQLCSQPPCYL